MQQGKWRYIVSKISCLLLAFYLSGCGGGPGGAGGFSLSTLQSTLQSANQFTGGVRDLQNNVQQVLMKLNTYSNITVEGLANAHVSQLIQALENLAQGITNAGIGGIQVDNAVKNIYLRLPPQAAMLWSPWIVVPVITVAINIQASYLSVSLQYINKNASTMLPNEVSRLNTVLTTSLASFTSVGA